MSRAETVNPDDGFMWLSLETWVKIILGWATASLIGIGGWFLYVRDSFAERPTIAEVDVQIQQYAKVREMQVDSLALIREEKLSEARVQLREHDRQIRIMEVATAAYVEIHRAQNDSLRAQSDQLTAIQAQLNALLIRGDRDR